MQAVDKDLMDMKVTELKAELEARGEVKTGNKAWLRRRLHAAIVRDHLTARQHVTRNLMRTRESGEGPTFSDLGFLRSF